MYGMIYEGAEMRKERLVVLNGSDPDRPAAAKEVGATGGVILPKIPKKKTKRWAAIGWMPALTKAGAAKTARMR